MYHSLWQQLRLQMQSKKIILLGEAHGAAQNPSIVRLFVKRLHITQVFFEWPQSWQRIIDAPIVWIKKNYKYLASLQDGRFLKQHFALLAFLKKEKVQMYCIDNEEKDWNTRDKIMADYILFHSHRDFNALSLAVFGNLHARQSQFVLNKRILIPVGVHLKNHATSVQICYGNGSINNFSIRKISSKHRFHIQKNGLKIAIRNRYFDYIYCIKRTSPGIIIKNLG